MILRSATICTRPFSKASWSSVVRKANKLASVPCYLWGRNLALIDGVAGDHWHNFSSYLTIFAIKAENGSISMSVETFVIGV
jgi:hypothetical protein